MMMMMMRMMMMMTMMMLQEWPQQFEELLQSASIPASSMALPLGSYVDILCSLLDIPVYK